MANPNTYKAEQTNNGGVDCEVTFAIGAAGAVGTVSRSRECNPTTPVTHVSTGLYRVTLKEAWIALLAAGGACIQAAFSTAGACHVRLSANGAASNPGTLDFEFRKATDFSLVDPASGDVAYLWFKVQKIKPTSTP